MQVLVWTALHAVVIHALVMAIDYHFYGQIVSPIWNIFAYNTQSGGDELYGVEPLSHYIKNLLLNFNLVSLLGVVSLPVLLLKKMAQRLYPEALFGDDHKCNKSTTSMEILVSLFPCKSGWRWISKNLIPFGPHPLQFPRP